MNNTPVCPFCGVELTYRRSFARTDKGNATNWYAVAKMISEEIASITKEV